MDRQMNGQMDGRMDGRTDGRTDGQTDGRTDRWTDELICVELGNLRLLQVKALHPRASLPFGQ